jgi:type IV secretion system protein TrbL
MNSTILNDIVRDYESISSAWTATLLPIAQAVFWTLVLIELVWSAVWWVVDREDGLGVITALLRKVLAVGFFYALLINGPTWIRAVIDGFTQAGASASGLTDLSPSGVFDQGLALANKILNSVEGLGILEGIFPSLVAVFTALVVVVSFAIIAAQLLVALVESFVVIGAGILFVGFSGSRWTKFFTERYLSYLASVGVKLLVLYLIMGVGMSIAARWVPILERGGFSPIPFFYVMGGSLVFLFLTWHIPSVASAMMVGAVHLSLADVYYPLMLAGRATGLGMAAAGAVMTVGRWSGGRLREWTALHTGGRGDASGATGGGPPEPSGGGPSRLGPGPIPRSSRGPAGDSGTIESTGRGGTRRTGDASTPTDQTAAGNTTVSNTRMPRSERPTPPNSPAAGRREAARADEPLATTGDVRAATAERRAGNVDSGQSERTPPPNTPVVPRQDR